MAGHRSSGAIFFGTNMLKAGKVEMVKELTEELKSAKSFVLVNYTGLNVKAQQDLKRRLNEVNGRMVVVKNTLLKRAIESAGLDKESSTDDILAGQTAIVLASEDPIAPIQALGKFAKEFDLPKFKVGVVEGTFQDSESLVKLSTLPGRDALLGQVLGSLVSNLYGLVGTLQSPMQQLVYTLNAKAKA
jgi:large subunit ribosomal protein L10